MSLYNKCIQTLSTQEHASQTDDVQPRIKSIFTSTDVCLQDHKATVTEPHSNRHVQTFSFKTNWRV